MVKPNIYVALTLGVLMSPKITGAIEVSHGKFTGPDIPPPTVPPYNSNKSQKKHQKRSAEAIKRRRLKRLAKKMTV